MGLTISRKRYLNVNHKKIFDVCNVSFYFILC